jgi:small-conductance mechanosensitive channel
LFAELRADVLHTPEPAVDLREFAASSINFMLYVFVDDISKTAATCRLQPECPLIGVHRM